MELKNVKIGDRVKLVAGENSITVTVTDVLRCIFTREVIALEFKGRSGDDVQFPIDYFTACE